MPRNSNYQDPAQRQSIKIPVFFDLEYSETNSDTLVENAYLDVVTNQETGTKKYRAIKRPAIDQYLDVTGGVARRARGIYYWNSTVYSIYDDRIYANATLIYTGVPNPDNEICGISASHPNSVAQYLVINAKTACYLVDTANNVLVMNNVVVSTSSVAASTTITTATVHGLATGNRVIIRGHTGSTPNLNDTVYTVTVTGATTFTIPVTVTVGGTGGTLGSFPVNLGSLETLDGYFVVATQNGRIYNSSFNDPTTWPSASYIVAQMDSQELVGLAKQNNYLVALGQKTTQFFVDAQKAPGSPFENVEQAVQQIGCISRQSIVSNTDKVFWIGNSRTGGFSVFMLENGTNLKPVGTDAINTYLNIEAGTSPYGIVNTIGTIFSFRASTFYGLLLNPLAGADARVFVYNLDSKLWTIFTTKLFVGLTGVSFPIINTQIQFSLFPDVSFFIGQDPLSGTIWKISDRLGEDYGFTSIDIKITFPRLILDTFNRKFIHKVEVLGRNFRGDTGAIDCTAALWVLNNTNGNPSSIRTIFLNQSPPDPNVPPRLVWKNVCCNREVRLKLILTSNYFNIIIEGIELDVSIGVG